MKTERQEMKKKESNECGEHQDIEIYKKIYNKYTMLHDSYR